MPSDTSRRRLRPRPGAVRRPLLRAMDRSGQWTGGSMDRSCQWNRMSTSPAMATKSSVRYVIEYRNRAMAARGVWSRRRRRANTTKSAPSTSAPTRYERPHVPHHREEHRHRHEQHGVEEDLLRGAAQGGDDGEHGHVRGGVVLAVADGEGPEVRRGPDDDHREQHQRRPPQASVTAAHPTSTGTAPAAPPITMFWVEVRLSHSV